MISYYLKHLDWDLKQHTDGSAGYDVRADVSTAREIGPLGFDGTIHPGQRWLVPTGLHLAMPKGIYAQVTSRSGLAMNHGVVVLNAPGIIDSDYRQEIKISLINLGDKPFKILPGERVAQLLFLLHMPQSMGLVQFATQDARGEYDWSGFMRRVGSVDQLGDPGTRGGGHGSTGR